ncbi:MAG TPA: biotin--[acetyl-CoA-carboxylase] ligase [Candidatus Limnocylindrales bacterium]|nr:biotin--[acetyl-CoA-carboxylase] ligase [Candidatus Limnocylindrales bacterium]
MTWLSRVERFEAVGSTNDVVAGWLAEGTPEVCLAVADAQTAGRGRNGRTWTAPSGTALLASLGFRPTYLEPDAQWRLAAIASLAMAKAAEQVTGLTEGTIRLKWPNDLVVSGDGGHVRKLAGVLGETHGAGTDDPQAIIGIGVNADWDPAEFPAELANDMTSLRHLAPGVHATATELLETFTMRLGPLVDMVRRGEFPSDAWRGRQLTNGTVVRLERPDGSSETVRAVDVDPASGALVIESLLGERPARAITVGEIRHLRLAEV